MPNIATNARFSGSFLRDGDFVVTNDKGCISAVVEVKKWKTVVRETAVEFAEGVFARWSGQAHWFVLVTPESGYAWRVESNASHELHDEFPVRPLLEPYYVRQGTDPRDVDPVEFEVAVGAWLRDLGAAGRPDGVSPELFRALSDGDVIHEAA